MDREEQHRQQAISDYLANARAILHFCKDMGMSDEDALSFSTKSIDVEDFVDFYKRVDGKLHRLRPFVASVVAKTEKNRLESMTRTAENLGIYVPPEEKSDDASQIPTEPPGPQGPTVHCDDLPV